MNHDQLLAETLLRHFEGANLGKDGIELGWNVVCKATWPAFAKSVEATPPVST